MAREYHRCLLLSALVALTSVQAAKQEDPTLLDLDRYKVLREAERYQMDLAVKQFKAKQYAAAINEFGKFLKLHPESQSCSYAQFMIANAHENNRYVNEALKQYQKVLDYYDDTREAPFSLYQMSQCHKKSGEFKLETDYLMKIIKDKKYEEHPIVPRILYRLSELAAENTKKIDDVVEYRKRIVTNHPESQYFRTCVQWLARHYALVEDDPVGARQMIIRDPRVATKEEAEMWMADLYLAAARSDKEQAKDLRKKARDIWEQFPTKFPEATRYAKRCMISLAQSYRDAGDRKTTLEIYAKYLHKWPNDDGQRINISRYLEEIGRWNDARMEYVKLSDKMLSQWEVAYSYDRELTKADEAIAGYQKVIDTDFVRYAQAMYYMAEVYYRQKHEYEKAMKLFMESNYSPPTHLFRVADCQRALKRFDAAITQYAEIVTFFKTSAAQAYLRMGDVYLANLKKRDKAISVYKIICRQYAGTGESSIAHRKLEDLGVVVTEGGQAK